MKVTFYYYITIYMNTNITTISIYQYLHQLYYSRYQTTHHYCHHLHHNYGITITNTTTLKMIVILKPLLRKAITTSNYITITLPRFSRTNDGSANPGLSLSLLLLLLS